MRNIWTYLLLFFCSITVAQEVNVSSRLDTSVMRIGEQVELQLICDGLTPPDSIGWPEWEKELPGQVELIAASETDSSLSKQNIYKRSYTITAWDSGYFALPPFKVQFQDELFQTEAQLLRVNLVPIDTTSSFIDIRPVYETEIGLLERSPGWIYYLFSALVLLSFLIIWLYLRYEKKNEEKSTEVESVDRQHILHTLQLMHTEESYRNQDKKAYYSQLSDTLRSYLEEVYRIPALERTTAEIVADIQYLDIQLEDKRYLTDLLRLSDMVKFAKTRPSEGVAQGHLERAIHFVKSQDDLRFSKEIGSQGNG